MGRPKLLLPWGQTSVVGHLLNLWQILGAEQMVVVCAEGDQSLRAELARLDFPPTNQVVNPLPQRGMFSSIQCAAQWLGWKPSLTHWIIALGDQPHLRIESLKALLNFGLSHPQHICLPRQGGHRRHPVLLPKPAFLELALSSAADLRSFLDEHSAATALCDLQDPGLDLDLDHPHEYDQALRTFLQGQTGEGK